MVDELTKVNQKEHREDPRVGNSIKPFVLGLGNAAVWCQWKRGDCVAWRRLQQDVSISKWTGKESQQRLSFNHVHVMKPVLVQKRRRCSASQVADF
jgi:hypothetical protein